MFYVESALLTIASAIARTIKVGHLSILNMDRGRFGRVCMLRNGFECTIGDHYLTWPTYLILTKNSPLGVYLNINKFKY